MLSSLQSVLYNFCTNSNDSIYEQDLSNLSIRGVTIRRLFWLNPIDFVSLLSIEPYFSVLDIIHYRYLIDNQIFLLKVLLNI